MSKDSPRPPLPLDVRKALLLLGVSPDGVSIQVVVEAWKRQIVDAHPDKGGGTETAIFLNTAKDCVVHWLENGGGEYRGPHQSSPVPRHPHPSAGGNVITLPIPKPPCDDDEI